MKKFILGIVLFGSIFLLGCDKQTPANVDTTGQQESWTGTAKDLLEKKENVSCTFNFEDEESKEEGLIYVQDGKMKTSATIKLKKENTEIEAYSIVKDGYTYTRSNIQKAQGAKFKNIDSNSDEANYTEDPLNGKKLDFKCKKEKIDENLFNIPENISFMDISNYLKKKQ